MTERVTLTYMADMNEFHEIRFPEDVSWGSSGGPSYKTQIFESLKGYEKRNVDWSHPIMHFNVAFGIKTDDQIERVIEFFNARRGRLYGFRYKNWANYQIIDGPIATGDGFSRRLPLWKMYGGQGSLHYKRLWKIVRGSVRDVTIGHEIAYEGVDYYIDYDGGEIVVNNPPGYGIPIRAAHLEFDEPVRFAEDNLDNIIEAYNNNSLSKLSLVGIRSTFTAGTVYSPSLEETGVRDPHFGQVVLLLNFDDRDPQPEVTRDHSMMASVVRLGNTAQIDRLVYRSGGGSLHLGPYGSATIQGRSQDISAVPFTIELFAQRPREGELLQPLIGRWDAPLLQRSYQLRYNMGTERLEFCVSESGEDEIILMTAPWESTPDYFDYVRVDRTSAGWWVMRLNGIVIQTSREVVRMFGGDGACTVGSLPAYDINQGPFQGRIDSVRITTGIARENSLSAVDVPATYPRLGTHGISATSVSF